MAAGSGVPRFGGSITSTKPGGPGAATVNRMPTMAVGGGMGGGIGGAIGGSNPLMRTSVGVTASGIDNIFLKKKAPPPKKP